jgi:hypothetical protein
MLTSQNNDLRWILATIVESGNRRFWGWLELCFVTFFGFYFSCVRGTKTFFSLSRGKILQCSPYLEVVPSVPPHWLSKKAIQNAMDGFRLRKDLLPSKIHTSQISKPTLHNPNQPYFPRPTTISSPPSTNSTNHLCTLHTTT